MEKFRPESIAEQEEKLLKEAKDFEQETFEDSEIREEKVFTEKEIVGIIEQLAQLEEITSDDMEVTKKSYDTAGNLVKLDVKVTKRLIKEDGWEDIEYSYTIKGKHGKNQTDTSYIYKLTNYEGQDYPFGDIAAEYIDGEWKFFE
jgi:hypothetical protein